MELPPKYSIDVSWEKPQAREDGTPMLESEFDYFLLEFRESGDQQFQQNFITDTSVDHLQIVDLEPGEYYLRFATVDNNGMSSEPANVTVIVGE